jgi:hypothetical protein
MGRSLAVTAFAAVLATGAAALIVLPNAETRAQDKDAVFLIPAVDGYGVADCLTAPGSDCGRVVADAYCEAQGFARAESFGRAAADDLTGSVQNTGLRAESERPIRIACAS